MKGQTAALGEELRGSKARLGVLATLETGRIISEGLCEMPELIDICDCAGSRCQV